MRFLTYIFMSFIKIDLIIIIYFALIKVKLTNKILIVSTIKCD